MYNEGTLAKTVLEDIYAEMKKAVPSFDPDKQCLGYAWLKGRIEENSELDLVSFIDLLTQCKSVSNRDGWCFSLVQLLHDRLPDWSVLKVLPFISDGQCAFLVCTIDKNWTDDQKEVLRPKVKEKFSRNPNYHKILEVCSSNG